MSAFDFFTEAQEAQIESAIAEAELKTSGEIRVHLETKCRENVLDRAAYIFEQLEMHETAERNGVLFYLATDSHHFAILGDAGINAKVPDGFWEEIKEMTFSHFKKGEFVDGLINGILKTGEKLSAHFPYQLDDVNELSNQISYGK